MTSCHVSPCSLQSQRPPFSLSPILVLWTYVLPSARMFLLPLFTGLVPPHLQVSASASALPMFQLDTISRVSPSLTPPPVLFLNATFLSPMLYQVCSWMLKIFRSDQFHEVKDHMCLGCGDNSFSQHKWDTSDWRWERSTDVRSPLHLLRVIAKASLPITVSIPHWDENNLIIPKKRRDPAPYFSKQKQGNKWAWL